MSDTMQFLVSHGAPVLFAIVFAEQAGLPLPSAPWLLTAGALWASGKLNPALAIGVTAMAAVMADSLWFYIGRRGGQRVLRPFCRLSLARNSCVGRTKGLFARHGLQTLVAAKFLPGLGAVMPPLAGALGMTTGRFLLFDGLGSLFYGSFYIVAGFLFHDQLQQAMALLNQIGSSALLFAVVLVGGYVAFKYVRRRKALTRVTASCAFSMDSSSGPHMKQKAFPSFKLTCATWANPFIERLISTLRREYLDRLFFWTADDLERKLESFKNYYNAARVHQGLSGDTPEEKARAPTPQVANLENYRWQSHCRGLFELPVAA